MTRILSILCVAVVLVACESPANKDLKQKKVDVQVFLDKNMPGASVIEITQLDSAYSAFSDLLALRLTLGDYHKKLATAYKEMCDATSRKAFLEKQVSALDIIEGKDKGYLDILHQIIENMKDPFSENVRKNRVAVFARISLPEGKETNSYFFYEANEPIIGHSFDDIMGLINDVMEDNNAIRKTEYRIMNEYY